MKYPVVALSLFAITTLSAQRRMNWQNLCFNNPGAPVCQGRDYASKPEKKGTRKSEGGGQSSLTDFSELHLRFADPGADALVGFNVNAFRDSPLAHSLILQIAAKRGLKEEDVKKVFETLAGVDQIAVSIADNRAVVMFAGHVSEAMFPNPEPGLRAALVGDDALLFGRSDLVGEARQRMTADTPLSEATRFAEEQYGESDFWAVAAPKFAGPQILGAGVRRLTVSVSLGDQIKSDFGLQFFGAPAPEKLKTWQPFFLHGAVEGNAIHARGTIEASEAQQKVAQLLADPIGEQLVQLIAASRHLTPGEAPKHARPVIVGLD